jgi:hypothetical protein
MSIRRGTLLVAAAGAAFAMLVYAMRAPSHDRPWVVEQSRLPLATFDGDLVRIDGVRNFRWTETDGEVVAAPAWEERSYDLRELNGLWYVLSPFGGDWRVPAHAMLSFGFSDTAFVVVSVEARKEAGESYSVWRGLAHEFELMYVVADERDVIALRTNAWHDDVFVYPLRADPSTIRALFSDMLRRANDLREAPEFYDTLRSSCTTTILEHANTVATRRIPTGYRVLLPGYSDELLHELGLIRTDLDLEAARAAFRVNDRATDVDADFSLRIRTFTSEART